MNIIKTITDWPVIVQGAIGSALFWLVLEIGQRLAKWTATRVTSDLRAANNWALASHEASGEFAERSRYICIYAAMHYFLKAAIVGALSLAIAGAIDVIASVGYLISAYFLFRALAYVPHTTSWGTTEERKKAFHSHLEQVDAKIKASAAKGAESEQRSE